MLDQSLRDQLLTLFGNLKNHYTIAIKVSPDHPNRSELLDLLNQVADCSGNISIQTENAGGLSFSILKNNQPSNIIFQAVPNGHEFTTLLLVILNQEGIGKNLPDPAIINRIRSIASPIVVKSYISLTCTNCPDVVQALNILAIYNPNIVHHIIDGAIHQNEIDALNIQAVPTVYANGKLLHVGRSSLGELLGKMEDLTGTQFKMAEVSSKIYDVIVAGGGPAGVTAAIYSARKGLSVALVADRIGGQVLETQGIENMISYPQTTGTELTAKLKLHLEEYPIDILENRTITKVELEEGIKKVQTSMGETLSANALIIATGASWRKLNVPGESAYIGSGVAFCAHCDGPFYKGKKVVVVGGGNSGLEAAIDLSAIATHVTVLECLDKLKGDQILQNKLNTLPNAQIITNAEIISIQGDEKVNSISFKNRVSGQTETLNTDGVFVQIGLKANSQPFANLVKTNRFGEIEIDAHCRTKVPGIYAAGDVSIVPYKQIVIAMGEGSKAALTAFEDKIRENLV